MSIIHSIVCFLLVLKLCNVNDKVFETCDLPRVRQLSEIIYDIIHTKYGEF